MQLLPPLKFRYSFTVRVYGYVARFVRRLRNQVNKRRLENGLVARAPLKMEATSEKPLEIFSVSSSTSPQEDTKPQILELSDLKVMFSCSVNVVVGVIPGFGSRSNKRRFPDEPKKWVPTNRPRYFPHRSKKQEVCLNPSDLSVAVRIIFQWTSQEVELNGRVKCPIEANVE